MKIRPYGSRDLTANLTALRSLASRRKRIYLQSAGAVADPGAGSGRKTWVVSRALCRFHRIATTAMSAAPKQREMLKLQIERLSPFENPGSHFHIGKEFICLWIWDQDKVRQAAEQQGGDTRGLGALPETALQPAAADGWQLIQTLEGYEGQHWVGGGLAASRWWPQVPGAREWMLFQRGAASPPEQTCPVPEVRQRPPWLDKPWTRSAASLSLGLSGLDPALAAAGAGAAVLIAFAYVGAKWIHIAYDVHAAKAQVAIRSAEIEPQLQARTATLSNREAVLALRKLDQYPDQLWLMARVAEIMPRNDAHLYEWDFDRGQLQMKVTAGSPLDARYFVQSLEGVHGFSHVAAERSGSNGLALHFTVDPK